MFPKLNNCLFAITCKYLYMKKISTFEFWEDTKIEPGSQMRYHLDAIIFLGKKDSKYYSLLTLWRLLETRKVLKSPGHYKHLGPQGTWTLKAIRHSSASGTRRALEGHLSTWTWALEVLYLGNFWRPFHHIIKY